MKTPDDSPAQPDMVDISVSSLTFNPLTGDLQDLRLLYGDAWLWPHISPEITRLDDVIIDAQTFLIPLFQPCPPEWAIQAGLGVSRSNIAIHQYAQHHNSYVAAARSLSSTRIPRDAPTLSDAHIYALLAIHEARMAAELYCEMVRGIEEEMILTGVGHNDTEDIGWLRTTMAGWEHNLWHDAAQQTGTAEKFLMMAQFAANEPNVEQLRQAEATVAELQRRAQAAETSVQAYRQGRQPGTVSKLTKALQHLIHRSHSSKLTDILTLIRRACNECPIEGIEFQACNEDCIWYLDVATGFQGQIKFANLQRRLNRISDI